MLVDFHVDMEIKFLFIFSFYVCIFLMINSEEKDYNLMEIMDLAKLVLKSFLNLFRISVIILCCGSVFRHNSDVLSSCR